MNLSLPNPHCTIYQIPDLFTLKITYNRQATIIRMALIAPIINTKEIKNTSSILEYYLPSTLHSKCYNEAKLPFAVEVHSTEIGHLFEHILLEYLCFFKLSDGLSSADYSGVTQWNWEKDPFGVFNIKINSGFGDADIFSKALKEAVLLMQLILNQREAVPNSIPLMPNGALPTNPLYVQMEN